eukprot:gene14369-14470_t
MSARVLPSKWAVIARGLPKDLVYFIYKVRESDLNTIGPSLVVG